MSNDDDDDDDIQNQFYQKYGDYDYQYNQPGDHSFNSYTEEDQSGEYDRPGYDYQYSQPGDRSFNSYNYSKEQMPLSNADQMIENTEDLSGQYDRPAYDYQYSQPGDRSFNSYNYSKEQMPLSNADQMIENKDGQDKNQFIQQLNNLTNSLFGNSSNSTQPTSNQQEQESQSEGQNHDQAIVYSVKDYKQPQQQIQNPQIHTNLFEKESLFQDNISQLLQQIDNYSTSDQQQLSYPQKQTKDINNYQQIAKLLREYHQINDQSENYQIIKDWEKAKKNITHKKKKLLYKNRTGLGIICYKKHSLESIKSGDKKLIFDHFLQIKFPSIKQTQLSEDQIKESLLCFNTICKQNYKNLKLIKMKYKSDFIQKFIHYIKEIQ
ncbi:hypothetical protein ABPG74_004334 [Tetrahymena malaccensis]